ncbi:head GIN domain-containing protein [Geofilum rhodophaeum]|uniref:head GIN domain-containing protein n=1 Tax=Geofilum rhodophaeum TaxID=1965019 RepID=UPI000B51F456|nr:head GIN domain-containing protein [Geofilum rhodophaeum]
MKHNSIFLALMVSFMMSACVYGGTTDLSGELVQQHHSLDAFNSIHVKTGVRLILTQGDTNAAMVEADSEVIDRVVLENKDGKLEIYVENPGGARWFQWGNTTGSVTVYLTFRELNELDASSGAHAETQGLIAATSFQMDASSGAHLDVSLNAAEVEVEASSGAHITLKGQADRISADASSGAHIKAADFIALGGVAEASSGAHVTLFVNGSADAKASSGAQVRVLGDVALKNIESSSGGSIKTR